MSWLSGHGDVLVGLFSGGDVGGLSVLVEPGAAEQSRLHQPLGVCHGHFAVLGHRHQVRRIGVGPRLGTVDLCDGGAGALAAATAAAEVDFAVVENGAGAPATLRDGGMYFEKATV